MSEVVKSMSKIYRTSKLTAYAHFRASERLARLHNRLGIPSIAISIILGSVIFADLQNIVPDLVKWVAGSISLVAAFLTALQTFFNPKESANKHREIANSYLSINKRSEIHLSQYEDGVISLENLSSLTEKINNEYGAVNKSAQDFPTNDDDWKKSKHKIGGEINGYKKKGDQSEK